jgi:hypothetical protein
MRKGDMPQLTCGLTPRRQVSLAAFFNRAPRWSSPRKTRYRQVAEVWRTIGTLESASVRANYHRATHADWQRNLKHRKKHAPGRGKR